MGEERGREGDFPFLVCIGGKGEGRCKSKKETFFPRTSLGMFKGRFYGVQILNLLEMFGSHPCGVVHRRGGGRKGFGRSLHLIFSANIIIS